MKKILLTESEKKAIQIVKENAIINSFAKEFNKIKRVGENKLNEGWKTNLAAGLATAVSGIQAQNSTSSETNSIGKEIQQTKQIKSDTNVADPYNVNRDNSIWRTIPIVGIKYNVNVGKLGTPAVYVYHNRTPEDPGFNPKTDREVVYMSNIDNLRRTAEYQKYMRGLQNKSTDSRLVDDN